LVEQASPVAEAYRRKSRLDEENMRILLTDFSLEISVRRSIAVLAAGSDHHF
jgi:hypothetical protein